MQNNRKLLQTFTYYSYEYFELLNFSPKQKKKQCKYSKDF